jgi:hypothetical protein
MKLAHIGFNTDNIKDEIERFKTKGYGQSEKYVKIPNPSIKSFLTKPSPNHSLSILKKNNYANIEVVEQGTPILQPTFIKNYFEDKSSIKFILRTKNIVESLYFWRNLGAETINACSCSLKLPLDTKPISLSLEEEPLSKKACLDGAGYYSLAFFCRNARKEHAKLAEKTEYNITECADLCLSDKKITFFFLIGRQNELIEIYSIDERRGEDENR